MTCLFLALREEGFSQWLSGKMCCISCSKISVSFFESLWIAIPPLGKVYVCFILIFFEERSLIHFFISAELFGFISWGILSISLMFVSFFLIVQTKSTEVWSFDRDDISSLSVLVFCLLSIDELNWWGVWSVWCVFDVSEIRLFDESVWVSTDFLFPAGIILVKSTPRVVADWKEHFRHLKKLFPVLWILWFCLF